MSAAWPIELRGLTESVVTTPGPDGTWHVAALGLHPEEPVRARTWGRTRTRRNLDREGRAVVQFTRDPVWFVEAALGAAVSEAAVVDGATAWVEVAAERLEAGRESGTEWVDWTLRPVESAVVETAVLTIERGFNAVVEATVDASRLGVPGFDEATLRDRLARHRAVVERCGGPRDREAMDRLDEFIEG